jgi:hypothetical protein
VVAQREPQLQRPEAARELERFLKQSEAFDRVLA